MYQIQFYIVDSSPDGLVMQKKTLKWKPSTEKMYLCDEILKAEVAINDVSLKCTCVSLGFLIA